jgi:leucine-zipper of insertion element IS481/Integrase core domain
MPHHRARLTPRGREMVVRRVVDDGMSFARAAAWGNVSKSTVWEWVRRWRAATPDERESLACLLERSSRPHNSPSRCPVEEEQRICELRRRTGWSPRAIAVEVGRPHSTVHQVLRRGGCSRPEPAERPPVVRYEWPCPGNLLHMDVKKLEKFTEPGRREGADRDRVHPPRTGLVRRARIVAERLMSDNAFVYIHNKALRELLYRRQVGHLRTRPYTPRTNGKVERYQQTLQREWAYALQYASSDARRASLPHWINHYNERHTHSALGNHPPIARVRDATRHNS